MRYHSRGDSTLLGKSSLGPVLMASRRQLALPIPGRGLGSFGASTGMGPPVGVGAGAGAEIGAAQGASIGSAIVPGIGTAVGALVGAIGGAIAGSLNKRDPEQANFDQAVALWQQNPDNIYAIGNKYLPLAGLFDLNLRNPHIPIYQRYGRMGEQRFVNDLTSQVYQAAQSGRIGPTDTPLSIMAKVVQPWIDSWGYGPMVDPHADMINRLMVGLIMDYVLGRQGSWRARSGDFPFGNITPFSLPQAAQPQTTASPTPSPVASVPSATTASVSTTPPAIGTPINSVRDNSTGQMIAIPPGGTFAGLTSTGGWLVTYPAGGTNPPGTYASNNGVLTPYGASGQLTAAVPAGFKATGQNALLGGQSFPLYTDAAGNVYLWTGSQMIPYNTANQSGGVSTMSIGGGGGGGGGGGYYPQDTGAPQTATAQAIPQSSGIDTNTILIAVAAGLGLLALVGARR
jgi:hypothetical protein